MLLLPTPEESASNKFGPRVANLAILKPHFEILGLFNALGFFKSKKVK